MQSLAGGSMVRILNIVVLAFLLAGCAASSALDRHDARSLDSPYRLDSGDQLRIVVFDQANLSDSYLVDAGGHISMPLIGPVRARERTTQELERVITAALGDGFLRDPSVSVQVETHRPFFILGEVGSPGQYPFVAGMTAETAVAIAGGFTPRAVKSHVRITRRINGEIQRARVPISFPVAPGDTIQVIERWF